MTQYYDQIVALSQSILDYWAVSQELRDAVLKKRVDSRVRSQAIDIQTQMPSFNFFFGVQLGVLVLRHNSQLILYFTIHTHVHVILKSTVNCKNMFFIIRSTTTRFLSQHKDYIGTLQGMEILLLKVLHEEYFGHELSQYLCFLAMS